MKIAYNIAPFLAKVARGLKVSTYDDYEKIKKVIDLCDKMTEEFNSEVVQDVLKSHKIKGEITEKHKKFKQVNEDLNVRYMSGSSVEVKDVQVFSRKELHSKIDGLEMNFEERDLLERLLVKDENK